MQRRPQPSKKPAARPRPRWRLLAAYGALAIVAFWAVQAFSAGAKEIDYSRFRNLVTADRVVDVTVTTTKITGHYCETKKVPDQNACVRGEPVEFETNQLPVPDEQLVPDLRRKNVRIEAKPDNPIIGILLSYILPFGLIIVVWIFLMRRIGGPGAQALQFGRSRAKVYNRKEMRTTFGDVAGVDEAVGELKEIVDFLKQPQKYQRLGGRPPKGVLLVGPPGSGKTLLARAVAGEADVPFFYMSGSEFVEMFVGVGASRVRELFEQAKGQAPCIIFIDELDTIGKSRSAAITIGGHDEREQTLNQLLAEMDGFDPRVSVIMMAATNRPEVLDQALMRPGRFDRIVVVDRPDLNGRVEILKVHARKVKLAPNADLRSIAAQTPGAAGAELENIINEAALLAARRGTDAVHQVDLQEAIERVMAGIERKSRVLSDKEKDRVAHHETGHALVGLFAEHADPVHKVSIIPRGAAALGMTIQVPMEDRYLLTEPELQDRLTVLLGGRAAEEIVLGNVSTGASDDLQKATDIARHMVEQFGMSPKVGPIAVSQDGQRFLENKLPWETQRNISEELARTSDQEVTRLVTEAYERAKRLLTLHKKALLAVADELKREEVLDGERLRTLVKELEATPSPEA
ncbi:MAG: ATP-dependent zinc metalloprotease FtsH [Actinomycetota bacterium]